MIKASHDRFGARMCVMVLKQDLISPLIEEGDRLSPVLYSQSCI